jgi:hypothetical protein
LIYEAKALGHPPSSGLSGLPAAPESYSEAHASGRMDADWNPYRWSWGYPSICSDGPSFDLFDWCYWSIYKRNSGSMGVKKMFIFAVMLAFWFMCEMCLMASDMFQMAIKSVLGLD